MSEHPDDSRQFAVAGLVWPAGLSMGQNIVQKILESFCESEFLPSAQIQQGQLNQAGQLLRHAVRTVPHFRDCFSPLNVDINPKALRTIEEFRSLPLLRRRDLQRSPERFLTDSPPRSHGRVHTGQTSGSTGSPIQYRGTTLTNAFWRAMTVRDHLWRERNFQGRYAVIRALAPNDRQFPNWGPATAGLYETGPSFSLDIRNDIEFQIHWLQAKKPDYLQTYPTNLRALLQLCTERRLRLPFLKGILTTSETLDPDLRQLCLDVLGVPLADCYSAEEVGYIALQCPSSDLYHIQAEHVLVELLDEDDMPCAPGQPGRVVITTLTNFAMPLIRYEILDYAIAGPPCPCGRGLPTLTQILGRTRNLLMLPDGRRYWPLFGFHQWMNTLPITQMQLVQKKIDQIDVRYVSSKTLTQTDLLALAEIVNKALKHPFSLRFVPVNKIERGHGGKFEDFISEI